MRVFKKWYLFMIEQNENLVLKLLILHVLQRRYGKTLHTEDVWSLSFWIFLILPCSCLHSSHTVYKLTNANSLFCLLSQKLCSIYKHIFQMFSSC